MPRGLLAFLDEVTVEEPCLSLLPPGRFDHVAPGPGQFAREWPSLLCPAWAVPPKAPDHSTEGTEYGQPKGDRELQISRVSGLIRPKTIASFTNVIVNEGQKKGTEHKY